jgi:hypothetical protein
MIEKMTETKNGTGKGSWRRAFSGAMATVITATTIAGCVDIKTPEVNPTPTLEASPISGTGEFSVLFTPNSLQNLDSDAKEIVSKNLELIAGECKKDLPGMIDGSEKYLYSRNMSNDIFIWGFCDVAADTNGPERTVVTAFDWMAGPAGEMTKINRDLVLFDDDTIGYVDVEGNSHAVLKKTTTDTIEVYDVNEKVVAQQIMTPEAISFFGKIKEVSAEPLPTATSEPTVESTVEANIEGISSIEEIQTRIDDYLSGKEDWSVTGPNKENFFINLIDESTKLPFSTLKISDVNDLEIYFCQQEGVYLGSYVLGGDQRIVSFFGTRTTDNMMPIVEIFSLGFIGTPDFLPDDLKMNYAFVDEKKPDWYANVMDYESGENILNMLSGKENKVIAWGYICSQTPEAVDHLINVNTRPDLQSITRWQYEDAKKNKQLFDWLRGLDEKIPDSVIIHNQNYDYLKLDEKNILSLLYLIIPTSDYTD